MLPGLQDGINRFRMIRLPGYRFRRCAVKCGVHLKSLADDLPVGMLVHHRARHIPMTHGVHDLLQIAGLRQHETAVVVAGAVEHKIRRQAYRFPCRNHCWLTIAAPTCFSLRRDCHTQPSDRSRQRAAVGHFTSGPQLSLDSKFSEFGEPGAGRNGVK